MASHPPDDRIPVSLLTGFLGSGKTTLLNAWLRSPDLADAAVIVNEFGAVGIDHSLIAQSSDNTIELSTGCLCCTVRGDLVETLRDLTERRSRGEVRAFSRVLIETTGLADPVPVIQALITFPVARRYRLGRVITTVDSVNGLSTLDRYAEAVKQAVVADELVLTKVDLAAPERDALLARLAALNPGTTIQWSRQDMHPPAALLSGLDVYDPATRPEQVMAWLKAERYGIERVLPLPRAERASTDTTDGSDAGSYARLARPGAPTRHADNVASFCLEYDEPLEWQHVAAWLDALVLAHGEDLLRVKGIVHIAGEARPIVVQAVQRLFHPPSPLAPSPLAAWTDDERRSRIVFITRGLRKAYVAEVFDTLRGRVAAPV